jgi:hypothetical protein
MVLFGIPGLLMACGGLFWGIWVLDIYGRTKQLAVGYLLGAVLLCLTGMLALFAALILQSMKELLRGQYEQFQKSAEQALNGRMNNGS